MQHVISLPLNTEHAEVMANIPFSLWFILIHIRCFTLYAKIGGCFREPWAWFSFISYNPPFRTGCTKYPHKKVWPLLFPFRTACLHQFLRYGNQIWCRGGFITSYWEYRGIQTEWLIFQTVVRNQNKRSELNEIVCVQLSDSMLYLKLDLIVFMLPMQL